MYTPFSSCYWFWLSLGTSPQPSIARAGTNGCSSFKTHLQMMMRMSEMSCMALVVCKISFVSMGSRIFLRGVFVFRHRDFRDTPVFFCSSPAIAQPIRDTISGTLEQFSLFSHCHIVHLDPSTGLNTSVRSNALRCRSHGRLAVPCAQQGCHSAPTSRHREAASSPPGKRTTRVHEL